MAGWHVRDFGPDDLEAVVRLDAESGLGDRPAAFRLSDVVAALHGEHPAVVAVADGHLVGAAVGRRDADRAWILRIALHPAWRNLGMGSALVAALEHRLHESGARTVAAVLREDESGATALRNSGFLRREGMTYFEKPQAVTAQDVVLLKSLDAAVPSAGLWARLAGMEKEKHLIERRLVLPLAHSELAAQHGVEPPRAVVLFGPPGTGKSTFARAVASRLGWPFAEIFPARLALEEGMAPGLRRRFDEIAQLDHVVVFIDEVEDVAGRRTEAAGHGAIGVVNELLTSIVRFRDRDSRLLICATNDVSALDPAFLRHGRFDYVLPVGPPDVEARRALWSSYLAGAATEADIPALADASEGFTPADIAQVARLVAQSAFERTLDTGHRSHSVTEDYLRTISNTRPTVTRTMAEQFADQSELFGRT
ncbi:ATP-binding protein [Streptomyces sp. NPDC006463]|uniref:ATP-binding protein n=1 Tax=Streptomyces sp. NPDC006463 TaxID=3364746 RepID=UPI00368248C6